MNPIPPYQKFANDTKAVVPVVASILVFGFLVIGLAGFQAFVLPQQNAEKEFEHFEDVKNDMKQLVNAIDDVEDYDRPQFSTIQLGVTYQPRTITVNPPPVAGTLQTRDEHTITINGDRTKTIPTRFLEYEPSYNELETGSIWYENSRAYVEDKDGDGRAIIDKGSIINGEGVLTIIVLQNKYHESGTGRQTVELYQNKGGNLDIEDLGDEVDITLPTRLGPQHWNESLDGKLSDDEYEVENQSGFYNLTIKNFSSENIEIRTVGIESVPTDEGTDEIKQGLKGDLDYGDDTNFYDGDSDNSIQLKKNASGEIENPENVNEKDGDTSTAISAGSEEDLNVGFKLPQTDESADSYDMTIITENIKIGKKGDFGFTLRNSSGGELTDRREIKEKEENIYNINTSGEVEAISNNYDDLYLTLDSESSGKGNRELEIDYFELNAK